MQCLDVLEFLLDAGPRSAPVNMAMDEILLKKISRPLLRVYQWNRPTASFGYFEKYSAVEGEHAGRELVRRWTGGGVVLHGKDFTYSIMAPVDSPLFKSNAGESYRMIHEQIVETMRESGMRAWIASAASPKTSSACFENAVRHDILLDQQKIAGAAQRRTRFGLLHQGSIQCADLPANFGARLAEKLAVHVIERPPREGEQEAAARLSEMKYGADSWLRKY